MGSYQLVFLIQGWNRDQIQSNFDSRELATVGQKSVLPGSHS